MKPKPLSLLKNFTLPVAIWFSLSFVGCSSPRHTLAEGGARSDSDRMTVPLAPREAQERGAGGGRPETCRSCEERHAQHSSRSGVRPKQQDNCRTLFLFGPPPTFPAIGTPGESTDARSHRQRGDCAGCETAPQSSYLLL